MADEVKEKATPQYSLDDVQVHIKLLEKRKTAQQPLRDQIENDYGLISLVQADEMGLVNGRWEIFTGNDPLTLTTSYVRALADAKLHRWIEPLSTEEGKRKSKIRSMTEHLVDAVRWQSDQDAEALPSGKPTQDSEASVACEEGGVIALCVLWEEKQEDGTYKLCGDLRVESALNCYWIEDEGGIPWVCFQREESKEAIKQKYGIDVAGDSSTPSSVAAGENLVIVNDVWTAEGEREFCGTEWLGEVKVHGDAENGGLGYVPVRVLTVGSKPYKRSSKFPQAMIDSWQPVIGPARNLYKEYNRVMSAIKTGGYLEVKPPKKLIYNSANGGEPLALRKDALVAGGEINVDENQGHDVELMPTHVELPLLFQELIEIKRLISLAGRPPIADGITDTVQTASGTDQLIEASKKALRPYLSLMNKLETWRAEEIVKQYKNGGFGETSLSGYEPNGKRFEILVKPGEINENEHFRAEYSLDLQRDEMGELALVEKKLQLGLLDQRGGIEELGGDPDLIIAAIERQQVEMVLGMPFRNVLHELQTDSKGNFDPVKAKENEVMIELLKLKLGETQPPPAPEQQGADIIPELPAGNNEMAQMAAEPTTDAARLNKLGLVPGR